MEALHQGWIVMPSIEMKNKVALIGGSFDPVHLGHLMLFYSAYTLTMLTYYATFSEIIANDDDRVFLSNTKSICDVVYFSLSFALVPVFVSMGMNIRIVALLFLPLLLCVGQDYRYPAVYLLQPSLHMLAHLPEWYLLRFPSRNYPQKTYLYRLRICSVQSSSEQSLIKDLQVAFSFLPLFCCFVK